MSANDSPHQNNKQEYGLGVQCGILKEDPDETCPVDSSDNSTSGSDVTDNPDLDGGYGWIIVAGSFFNAFIIDGVGSSFGLLFPYIVAKFNSSAFVTSFAGSLFVAFLIMGSVSAELVKKFGFRKVSIAGGILSCIAFVASAFSPNIFLFILTYGLLAGCSCGLVFLPSVIIVNRYFHQKRGIVNGIVTSGSGAGLLVLAPIINSLLEAYSLDGTIIILGGILLNMCVFSSLYRPPDLDNQANDGEKSDDTCGKFSLDSHSNYLSVENDGGLNQKDVSQNQLEIECGKSTGSGNDDVSHKKSKFESFSFHDSASPMDACQETKSGSEHKPKSYLEYMLSRLKPGVLAPPKRIAGSQKGVRYGCEKSEGKHTPGKATPWKSEYQLYLHDVGENTIVHQIHLSTHNIPSWCHDKGSELIPQNSMMKQQIRGSFKSQDHNHHPKHHHSHSHQHHSGYLAIDHGSNLYLAGSLATLKNLHTKHIMQNLQESLAAVTQSNCSSSKLQIDIVEIPTTSDIRSETETLILPPANINENYQISDSTKSLALLHKAELPQHTDMIANTSELHISSRSSARSGCTSLTDVGHGDTISLENDVALALPAMGYTITQLLHKPSFHLFCLGACLIQIGYPIAGTFLADYAYQNGLTTSHTAVLMGLLGGLNICGRLLSGALVNLRVDPLHLNNVALLLGGVACLLCPFYTELWSLCMFAALFGFFLGFFPPIQPLIIVEYFGLDSLASAFGFLTTIKGVASIMGAPIAGWIYDASGQYSVSFVFAGAVFVLSSVVHWIMPCVRISCSKKLL